MFEEAVSTGTNIGLLATFAPSIPSMEKEFQQLAQRMRKTLQLTSVLVPESMEALLSGDRAAHNRLLAAAAPQLSECDTVMLAQFSTSLAVKEVSQVLNARVLTSPHSAVDKLRSMIYSDE